MPTAAYNKFNEFVQNLGQKEHDLSNDVLKFALTNTAPSASDASFLPGTLHPAPAAANGYAPATATVTYTETGGTATLALSSNVVFTASGGQIGPFRYVILYNDTGTTPTDPVISYYDYGSSITLEDTETFTINSGTLLTIA